MATKPIEVIVDVLEQRAQVRVEGKGWRTRCPNPGHLDEHPSFFLYPGGGGRCFTQCARYWSRQGLGELLGIDLQSSRRGLTLRELADAKGLPVEFLESVGVTDGITGSGSNRGPCVDIPYVDQQGEIVGVHKRLRLSGDPRFVWRRGDHTTLYGQQHIRDLERSGSVILVEGETDAWTLWHARIPALALPGASTWHKKYAPLLEGVTVYLWHEPDGGGDELLEAVSRDLPDVRIIEAPADAKDPSDLYLLDPDHFKESMKALAAAARPVSDILCRAATATAEEALNASRHLLDDPNLFDKLRDALAANGYAGDVRPALMAYVTIASRLLDDPLNVAYISESAAGKNAAVDVTLPFFPAEAYYLVRASSPRALIYNDEVFAHRVVILTEADSLPEEGPAASAMRSLMSDREMMYEVVERAEDGQFHVRRISKPGPTGLITTSVKPLGAQASTRTLAVSIPDTAEQTRLVLHAQADKANDEHVSPDFAPWLALQLWLELVGERRVSIPFNHALAESIPTLGVRMRRDFPQLLTTIKTIALLRQQQRERDAKGRIVATLDDYRWARWILEEVFTTTASEGASPAVRETVKVVARLSDGGTPVSEKQLILDLGLAKSTISYRVKRALQGEWLVNQAERGATAQLLPGAPLPDGCPLPEVDSLRVCVENTVFDSNLRTPFAAPGAVRSNTVREQFESEKAAATASLSQGDDEFERFEPPSAVTAHTQDTGNKLQSQLPWDNFLEKVERESEPG